MTNPTPDEQQLRIPGVKYREVTRTRWETTTINGIPESREVAYSVLEPVPPRDWDALVVRGVTGFAVVATILAAVATTAAVGGLLSKAIPAAFAYGGAVLFTGTWLTCLGVEWLERRDPERAMPARVTGWAALVIAMAAVVAYGVDLKEPLAGGAGACLDLLAKGVWALVIRYYAAPLSEPVAFWLRRRREKIAAEAAVSEELQRLDRMGAYNRAVYGPTAATAAAVTTATEPRQLSAADVSVPVFGQAPAVSAPLPAPPAPAPAPAPAPVPAAAPSPAPDPAATAGPKKEPELEEEPEAKDEEPEQPTNAGGPTLRPVGTPSIAGTIRAVLTEEPKITDADLIVRVAKAHGPSDKYADTVPRTRRRIENPPPRKKRKAS